MQMDKWKMMIIIDTTVILDILDSDKVMIFNEKRLDQT